MTSQYNSNYDGTMAFSDTQAQINVETGGPQSWTIPGANNMVYQADFVYPENSNVYVGLNVAPTNPTVGSVSNQPFVEFKPDKRYVRGADVLHFSTPDTNVYFGVSLRQLQG